VVKGSVENKVVIERWRAFYPNAHQMVVGRVESGQILRVFWVDLGPDHSMPPNIPFYFNNVLLSSGHLHSVLMLQSDEHGEWCFSTSKNG
jgi:hypothetical protein